MNTKIMSNTHSTTIWEDMRHWLMSEDIETFSGQVIYNYLEDVLKMLDIRIAEVTQSSVVFRKGDDQIRLDKTELLNWINSCIRESDYDAAVLHESLETMMLKVIERMELDITELHAWMFTVNIDTFLLPAICDISRIESLNDTWIVNRINVPVNARGRGIGNELLCKLSEWADKYQQTLVLYVSSSGSLSDEDLRDWYMRNGFEIDTSGLHELVRYPRKEN